MDKIFRRATQSNGLNDDEQIRKRNECNRTRSVFLNFRMTPTERELIETRIKLSGLSKSQYFIESCLYQTILVKGNIKTFTEINNSMKEIYQCLNTNPDLTALDSWQIESLRIILEILDRLFGSDKSRTED